MKITKKINWGTFKALSKTALALPGLLIIKMLCYCLPTWPSAIEWSAVMLICIVLLPCLHYCNGQHHASNTRLSLPPHVLGSGQWQLSSLPPPPSLPPPLPLQLHCTTIAIHFLSIHALTRGTVYSGSCTAQSTPALPPCSSLPLTPGCFLLQIVLVPTFHYILYLSAYFTA